jgi:multidrug resistance efflux pump
MAFNASEGHRIGVSVPQYVLRHVKPGQPAEIVLKLFPGKAFAATVDTIAPVNSEGQVQASGMVPSFDDNSANSQDYAVVLKLDERIEPSSLPGGAVGTATIYTDSVSMTHVIRRVMMRMQAWMNYILP